MARRRVRGDTNAAIEFLRRFHPDGLWVLSAVDPDEGEIETRTFGAATAAEALAWIERWNGKRNLYFSVNPPRRELRKKATKADIESLAWLHCDVDPRSGVPLQEERRRIRTLLTTQLPGSVPQPTCIIDSGGGYQPFWRLRGPLRVDGDLERAESAERYNRQLARLLAAPAGCHNIDRIMRTPGTINLPSARKRAIGRERALAKLVEFNDNVYDLDQFEKAPPDTSRDENIVVDVDTRNIGRLDSIDDLDQWHVSRRVKRVIQEGNDEKPKEGDDTRSGWLFDVCCQLVRCGVPDQVIYSIITDERFAISESVLDKRRRSHKYALRQIQQAKKQVARETDAISESSGASDVSSAEPEPLRRPLPPPAPYPLDALGDVLAPLAKRLSAVVQAPDALCGLSVLTAASLAAQAHADVLIDGRRELLSIWAVPVAESGDRKSAADDIALAPHRDFERAEADRWRVEMLAYRAALREESETPPEKPLEPWLLVSAPTVEGLHKLYGVGRPSVGLFHSDAGEFVGGYSMNVDNRMRSAAGMSKLWDRGEFDRIRAGEGATKYFGRRLSMHLMVQPVIAESILGDELLIGQGWLARCLLAWPESRIGDRPYVAVDLSHDPAFRKYRERMIALLEREPPLRTGARNELEPRVLVLSARAKRRWVELHNAIERELRDGGRYATIRAFGAKAAAQVLRVAGVLTLVGDPDATEIRRREVERAYEIVSWHLGEAVRIVGYAGTPVEIRHAEALLKWCHRERIELLHSVRAMQYGPAVIRTKRAFDVAAAELVRAGWAQCADGLVIDGKPRRKGWRIRGVPAAIPAIPAIRVGGGEATSTNSRSSGNSTEAAREAPQPQRRLNGGGAAIKSSVRTVDFTGVDSSPPRGWRD